MSFLIAYLATGSIFLLVDYLWLRLFMRDFFYAEMGHLLLEVPKLGVATAFYVAYAAGIVVLAVWPASKSASWLHALALGALLGLFAYGTYDLTNLATLKGWSWKVAVLDMAWGAFATAVAAVVGYFAMSMYVKG